MESKIYHHVLYININNKVLSHNIETSKDGIEPGALESYETTYNKINQVFRVSYYTYDSSMFKVRDYVVETFRSRYIQPSSEINSFAF